VLFFSVTVSLHWRPTFANAQLETKEQRVLRLKNFWDFCWWWAHWRSRWLLNTGQRTLYTVRHCLVQLWAEIDFNYRCYTSTTTPSNRHVVTIHSRTNCSNLDQWWIICLSIFNWCTPCLRMCVLTSLYCYGRGTFSSNNTLRYSALVLVWSCSSCVTAVLDIFEASEFILAKTTCFNFRQACYNHRLSLDELNALCGSWCCQFWRKDIVSRWTIITPAFHCLPQFWRPVAEIWPYTYTLSK